MPKRVPYRILAACFGFVGAGAFAYVAFEIARGRFFGGVVFYGMLYGVTAVGLWRRAAWGRMLGLVATVANAGLGVLAVLAAASAGRNLIGAAIFTLVNAAGAFFLAQGQIQEGAS